MPKSPRSHRVERESRAAFELLLGERLVYRREDPDYRIDGVVEEIGKGDNLTGLRFYVQLKATDEEDLKKALALSLRLETRDYYRSLSLPVLMVRYHAPSETFYTRWSSEYDPYYGGGGAKTFTFRWAAADAWDEARPAQLIVDAKVFAELRSPNPPLPRPIHVVSDGAFGLSETELLYAFREAAERCSDVIEVRGGAPSDGAAWIEVNESVVTINLAKVNGAVLHLPDDYDPGEFGEKLAIDGLLMSGPALANVDQFEIASRVIVALALESQLLSDAGMAAALQGIMAAARRVRESLELAEELDRSTVDAIREASVFFTLPALQHQDSLSKSERDLHKKTLRKRIIRRRRAGDPLATARELVNLANLHRSRGEGRRAVRLYKEAAETDPEYEGRAHYWREFGGVLWMDRQYERAATAYQRAIELGTDPLAEALYADCLMFAGRYAEARDLFGRFNEAHPDLAAEYRLKKIALDVIVDAMDIKIQSRDLEKAVMASPRVEDATPEAVIKGSLKQLRHDALWPSAWFNIGVAEGRRNFHAKALLAFIAGTTMMPEFDLEQWTHAAFYAWNLGEQEQLRDILITARQRAGAPILRALVKFGREQKEDFPREKLLAAAETIWDEVPRERRSGYTIRILSTEGVEEVEVSDYSR